MANPRITKLLSNCNTELMQMHSHYQSLCKGGCPTLTYANECIDAQLNLIQVIERLAAWRDNADLMLRNAKPKDERKWKNERDNYRSLLELLGVGN